MIEQRTDQFDNSRVAGIGVITQRGFGERCVDARGIMRPVGSLKSVWVEIAVRVVALQSIRLGRSPVDQEVPSWRHNAVVRAVLRSEPRSEFAVVIVQHIVSV